MALSGGNNLPDELLVIWGASPVSPSITTPDYISLKDVDAVEVVIIGLNGTTVTGSAVTLLQATAVAGTSEKALAFSNYYATADAGATDTLVKTTASSNTFTTTTTNSKAFVYRIPVDPKTLDSANGFDCLRAGVANAANTTITVAYLIRPKYAGPANNHPTVITD